MTTLEETLTEEKKSTQDDIFHQLTHIRPVFDFPDNQIDSFKYHLASLEHILRLALPQSIKDIAYRIKSLNDKNKLERFYHELQTALPIVHWDKSCNRAPFTITITAIAHSQYTHGIGRFVSDMASRWLLPGKQVPVVSVHSVLFEFAHQDKERYFIHESTAQIENPKEMSQVLANLSNMVNEIRLIACAVQHARTIVSIKPLSFEQKRVIIQENISSLFDRSSKEHTTNLYDHVHDFLIKAEAEKKTSQIKEQLAPLVEVKPQVFERDLFTELQRFVFLLKDSFTANRTLKHLTRIIAYKYLFRKNLHGAISRHPNQRHLSIKLLRTVLTEDSTPVVGILIGINLLQDNEVFGRQHILKAIRECLGDVRYVKGSSVAYHKNHEKIKTIYIEIEKSGGEYFTAAELKNLNLRLPREIKSSIQSVINPIFMPRNEEEVMRNILILSKQLKYVHDLPQMIITFHKQTNNKLSFTVIMLRLLKQDTPTLQQLFSKLGEEIKIDNHEVKIVGLLRKRYPKEANVFELCLNKLRFLRKDFSLDLYEARRHVFLMLNRAMGDIRDYNGGMISKQTEVLKDLKKLLMQANIHNDFLLENFFYSLTPTYMQSLLSAFVLKHLFVILLEALENDYSTSPFFLRSQIVKRQCLIVVASTDPSLKEIISNHIDTLHFEGASLTTSDVNVYDTSYMSFILKSDNYDLYHEFQKHIVECIRIWQKTIKSKVTNELQNTLEL